MKQISTIISIIVICLVFLYWFKKRPTKHAGDCASLWENMKNPNAHNIFINALSLTENDADIKANLIQQSAAKGWHIDYANCKYALKYVATHGVGGVVNILHNERTCFV